MVTLTMKRCSWKWEHSCHKICMMTVVWGYTWASRQSDTTMHAVHYFIISKTIHCLQIGDTSSFSQWLIQMACLNWNCNMRDWGTVKVAVSDYLDSIFTVTSYISFLVYSSDIKVPQFYIYIIVWCIGYLVVNDKVSANSTPGFCIKTSSVYNAVHGHGWVFFRSSRVFFRS